MDGSHRPCPQTGARLDRGGSIVDHRSRSVCQYLRGKGRRSRPRNRHHDPEKSARDHGKPTVRSTFSTHTIILFSQFVPPPPAQQRLGSIILKQDEDQEIALFEWTTLAVSNAESLQSQVTTLTDRIHNAEDTILKLKMQLSILIESKSTHDKQLMANFVQLLNQKKLKIRDQQRLLACATPDPKRGMFLIRCDSISVYLGSSSSHLDYR